MKTDVVGGNNMSRENYLVTQLDKAVLDEIVETTQGVAHGSVTLVVQDARLIQMDVVNKIRFGVAPVAVKAGGTAAVLPGKIAAALRDMQYGQVTLAIKGGEIVQAERTEKQRFAALQGLYGEGI